MNLAKCGLCYPETSDDYDHVMLLIEISEKHGWLLMEDGLWQRNIDNEGDLSIFVVIEILDERL